MNRIGRYEVVRELGRGGMGLVLLAVDPTLGRHVAIKQLLQFENADQRARFLREARAVGRLAYHPNVVQVHDVVEGENGSLFIVMEYVSGRTLATVMAEGAPLLPTQVVKILEGICDGLAAAHSRGIIHRDVKPANLMLDAAGVVKILDFGIAKGVGPTLTRQGHRAGTPLYMSPEQMNGDAVGVQTDVFATCLVAFELLTGYPFRAPEAHAGLETPLVPEWIRLVLRRGLQPNPINRYQNMLALKAAFERAKEPAEFPSAGTPLRDLPTRRASANLPLVASGSERRSTRSIFDTQGELDETSTGTATRGRRAVVFGAVASAGVVAFIIWLSVGPTPSAPSERPRSPGGERAVVGERTSAVAPQPADPPAGEGVLSRTPPTPRVPVKPLPGAGAAAPVELPGPLADPERFPRRPPPDELAAPATAQTDEVAVPATALPRVSPSETPPAASPEAAASAARSDQEAGIRATLRAFEAAFENLSSAALKRVQPSLSESQLAAWDQAFAQNSTYRVEVVPKRVSLLSESRARVDCAITRTLTPKGGGAMRTLTANPAAIVLNRAAGGWEIATIRGRGW